jgi:hypothetical protein
MINEKIMEDLIAANPEHFLQESGLKLIGRQFVVPGYRFDLLFQDRTGAKLIVEIQKGTLDRSHIYKILDYYDAFKDRNPHEFVEVMVVATVIPAERKHRLASRGISFREIPVADFLDKLESGPVVALEQESLCPSGAKSTCTASADVGESAQSAFALFKDQQARLRNALCENDPTIWFPPLRGNFEQNVPGNWFICFVPGVWGRWQTRNYGVHFDFAYARPQNNLPERFRLVVGVECPLKAEFRQAFKEDVISKVNSKRIEQFGFVLQARERKKLLETDPIPVSIKAWEVAFDRYLSVQKIIPVIADLVKEYSDMGRFDTTIEF